MTEDDGSLKMLPHCHQIQGMTLEHPGGPDPRLGVLRLQYTDQAGTWYEWGVPAPEARRLLALLQKWSAGKARPPGSPPQT